MQVGKERERASKVISKAEKSEDFTLRLLETARELGYEQVASLDELELTTEEKKKMRVKKGNIFLRAERKDGNVVKMVILAKSATRDFGADFFSVTNYQGHGWNHDFSIWEMEANLKRELTSKPYPNK